MMTNAEIFPVLFFVGVQSVRQRERTGKGNNDGQFLPVVLIFYFLRKGALT